MKDSFMTYWLIGIIFVCVYHLLDFVYIKSQGDDYVHPREEDRNPMLLVIAMNTLLTFVYPFFIVVIIVGVFDYRQKQMQMARAAEELLKKLDDLKEEKAREDEHN